VARGLFARTFAFYELFITAALLYLIMVYGVLFLFGNIEKRLSRYLLDRTVADKKPVPILLK